MASSSTLNVDFLSKFRGSADDITMSDAQLNKLMLASTDAAYRSSGAGSYLSSYQTILTQYDRMGYNPVPSNHERVGMTFFTRPRLNLMGSNLRQDRIMSTLDTINNASNAFSIRCYLDSAFASWSAIRDLTTNSSVYSSESAFIVPLSNQIQSISGWPPFTVGHESLTPGFYGENQTLARGSDFNNRTVDLSLTFRDYQGGYITSFFLYYLRYMALVCRGDMIAYQDDILRRELNYTMSIYRFVLDPTKRYITKWAKATGCFPYDIPIGSCFDFTNKSGFVHASEEVTIPFVANHIEFMDPIIFEDFNIAATEWGGNLLKTRKQSLLTDGSANFRGLPLIDTVSGSNELLWLAEDTEFENPATAVLSDLKSQINSQLESLGTTDGANLDRAQLGDLITAVPTSDYNPPTSRPVA